LAQQCRPLSKEKTPPQCKIAYPPSGRGKKTGLKTWRGGGGKNTISQKGGREKRLGLRHPDDQSDTKMGKATNKHVNRKRGKHGEKDPKNVEEENPAKKGNQNNLIEEKESPENGASKRHQTTLLPGDRKSVSQPHEDKNL